MFSTDTSRHEAARHRNERRRGRIAGRASARTTQNVVDVGDDVMMW